MSSRYPLQEIACLPDPADNCAIALRRLNPGTLVQAPDGSSFAFDFTVLEGHRFAIRSIREGEALLSWGMPCGILLANVNPGVYICNAGVLAELSTRNLDFNLPRKPNLGDFYEPYQLNKQTFRPASQVELYDRRKSFQGFKSIAENGALIGPWNPWLHEPKFGKPIWELTKTRRSSSPARDFAPLMRSMPTS